MATNEHPYDLPDSEYFAAYDKRLLDPVERVDYWERQHEDASQRAHQLAVLTDRVDLDTLEDPGVITQLWERMSALLAQTAHQRDEARRLLALWRAWHVTDNPPPTTSAPTHPAPVMRARPRERRPRRHVARATSSADSGDPDPAPPDPGACPLCDVPGRLIVLARIPGDPPSTIVLCTVCWGGPTSITHWGPR